jgi:hypothetical protein
MKEIRGWNICGKMQGEKQKDPKVQRMKMSVGVRSQTLCRWKL